MLTAYENRNAACVFGKKIDREQGQLKSRAALIINE